MAEECIPALAPEEDCATRIKKLVGYVCRNGVDFENMVKQKESGNVKFDFLRDGEGADYYKWQLFCGRRHYTEDTINRIESRHRDRIIGLPPGYLDLSQEDRDALRNFLETNTGSKECVKMIRKWILERAHSMIAIGAQLRYFVSSQLAPQPSEEVFTKLLHTVYIVNDVLFNRSSVTMKGPYTRILGNSWEAPVVDVTACLSPYLPSILFHVSSSATQPTGKERLQKIINLWATKEFIPVDMGKHLLEVVNSPAPPPDPAMLPLSPPYAVDLPPAILPPVPPAPPPPPTPWAHPLQTPPPPRPHPPGMPFPPPPPSAPPPPQPHMFPPPPGPRMLQPRMPPPGMVPPSAPPPPHPPLSVSLQQTSVGALANIVRNALKVGHAKYTPMDPSTMAQSIPPFVEPGRLEARVSQFYRKLESAASASSGTSGRGGGTDRQEYRGEAPRGRDSSRDDDGWREGRGYRSRDRETEYEGSTERVREEDEYRKKRRQVW